MVQWWFWTAKTKRSRLFLSVYHEIDCSLFRGEPARKHKEGEGMGEMFLRVIMSERAKNCTASGVPLEEAGSTTFPCPGCTAPIGRSPRCRNQGVLYNCPECGYQGP
jgi:hypothetical protein